jgi:hypothetical protein
MQRPLAVPDVLGMLYFVRLQVSRLYQVMSLLVSGCTVIICRLKRIRCSTGKNCLCNLRYADCGLLILPLAGTWAVYFWTSVNFVQGSLHKSASRRIRIHIERGFDETSGMHSIVF